MAIEIIDQLKQKNNGVFPLIDTNDVKGGYHQVNSIDERNNIPEGKRKEGMLCCVKNDKTYKLSGGISNSNWEVFNISGGAVKSTLVSETKEQISALKGSKGQFIYVVTDKDNNNESNVYIIESVDENNNITKYTPLSSFSKSAVPRLSYDTSMPEGTKLYKSIADDIVLKFNFESSTYGDAKYKIYRDGTLVKSMTGAKGTVIVNLGPVEIEGTYEFTVTATDFLGVPAPETLTFGAIIGGLKLSSSFDETLSTSVFEIGDKISVPFAVNCSDKTAKIKVSFKITNPNGEVHSEIVETGVASYSSQWIYSSTTISGQYGLEIQAYTGESIEDTTEGTFISDKLNYKFNVLQVGEIAIVDESSNFNFDTNTYISIPFRVYSKVSKYLTMKAKLYKKNGENWDLFKSVSGTGISCTVGIVTYWSIGKIEQGQYKYEMEAYTLDGGVKSLKPATHEIQVAQATYTRMQPVFTNLIAWFDANDKRNTDTDKDIWYNNTKLGDTYRIQLHDLNYKSNGWKHVDESLSDDEDGEYMLKFTGESYGELLKVNRDNTTTRYEPFSIFKTTGATGFTLETCIRSRCVGETQAKVITCMEGANSDTPGMSISYNKASIGSNLQTSDLSFIEDKWIHIALVIDKNIRTLEEIGQENIENLNPVYTMRIYLNGVLSSCAALKNDEFIDSSGRSFPLFLNACLNDGKIDNFGECEIKFLRLYNGHLTPTDVLNNYIASVYDLTEQQAAKDKNDVEKMKLPTVIFKRKVTSKNKTTFGILNSITQKKQSKVTKVDCVMEVNDGAGNITVYDNVDVYLQGTSSLQYPIKNYKIKVYSDDEHKKKRKIVPSWKEKDWKPDYVYTFKCDYMEESHKNNTPTATFYDKVWDALEAKSPSRKAGLRDSIDGFPFILYYNDDPDTAKDVFLGSFMWNLDKSSSMLGFEVDLVDDTGKVTGNSSTSCMSYEGSANASDTAGCFYKLEESIANVYKYYVEDSYQEYLTENGKTEKEVTLDQFKAMIANGSVKYKTYEQFKADYNETDYVMNDFEIRYSWMEESNYEGRTDEAEFAPMVGLVNWVAESVKNGTFKKDFEKHLNKKYMIAYYLQMQVFAQVDNCGKNCMWDTWDGTIFYPRPYDMDTQMGLSNTGTESIGVDAEIVPALSPTKATGTYAAISNSDTVTKNRYLSYNTKTSKLWNNFATEFKSDIAQAYKSLRSKGVYKVDTIMKHVNSLTSDAIGEIYFNKDGAAKYLTQTDESTSEYLKMLHGNRDQRYEEFITQRLQFLDTVYEYMESDVQNDTLNSIITLRSDALYGSASGEANTLKCYLGISVYTPQYVTVNVGSGLDAIVTAYISPNSTYINPNTGIQEEGTLFSFPIKGTDKEMIITGAGNIKKINMLEDLNVRDLVIGKAEKILKLDLSSSARMATLTLGNNKYLTELTCANSYILGTGVNGQSLNLSLCKNLKSLDLSYTKLSSVTLPENANLKNIVINGSTIKVLNINGMEFLENVEIKECEEIDSYTVNECQKISRIDVSDSSVKSFAATNCKNLNAIDLSGCKSLTSFDVTNSDNINTLNMSNSNSPIMNDLKLYTLYNLTNLDVSKSTSLNKIRFPKYANIDEANKAQSGGTGELWHKLTSLNLSNSSIKYIQYGSADGGANVCDMSQLTNLEILRFNNCTSVEIIENLNYSSKNLSSLFSYDTNLTKITGVLNCTGDNSNINNLFYECHSLNDINDLEFNFTNVTACERAMARCYSATTDMLKKILSACGDSLLNANEVANMWGGKVDTIVLGSDNDTTRAIPADLFADNHNIERVTSVFYNTKYTSIPGDMFKNNTKLKDLRNCFATMRELTDVGNDLIKDKPLLESTHGLFANCYELTNYINTSPQIFLGSPNITDTSEMFKSNRKLIADNVKGLTNMLNPLTKVTDISYMFVECSSLNCEIQNGLLKNNKSLQTIDGLFLNCSSLPTLPKSLFRAEQTDTNTFPNLLRARNVFGGCSSLSGIIDVNFFSGANAIIDISANSTTVMYDSINYYSGNGFFSNTKISGYYDMFLYPLTNLIHCGGLFNQSSANNSLKYCYYYEGSTENERQNTVSSNLFKMNTKLQTAHSVFRNNTGLQGCIPSDLFDSCKSNITDLHYMFEGCTSLTGSNPDATDGISNVGISNQWFKDARNLKDLCRFLSGCSGYTGTIPKDLFSNCTSLWKTANMFEGCTEITGTIPIELFNSCRNTLSDTTRMFYGCKGLDGEFPTGTYSTITGVNGYAICNSSDEGALQVVSIVSDVTKQISYNDVIDMSPSLATIITNSGSYYVKPTLGDITSVIQPGLLAECVNLTTTRQMFCECRNLGKGSGIPNDIFFTSKLSKKYTLLTDTSGMFARTRFDQVYIDENTNKHYLCDANLLSKCPNIKNASEMFRALYFMPSCTIYMNMFAKQTVLEDCSGLFYSCRNLTGAINATLFTNSLGTLKNAKNLFAYTKINNVSNTFLYGDRKNNKLQYVGNIFYNCTELTGSSPEFWNPDKFSKIESTESGYYGALYKCNKLSNYNAANSKSTNWTVETKLIDY